MRYQRLQGKQVAEAKERHPRRQSLMLCSSDPEEALCFMCLVDALSIPLRPELSVKTITLTTFHDIVQSSDSRLSRGLQQASILLALENDNAQIQRVLQPDASGASRVGSATTLDSCQLMETVHESHTSHSLPQVQHIRQAYEDLYQRCSEDKVCSAVGGVGRQSNLARQIHITQREPSAEQLAFKVANVGSSLLKPSSYACIS